MSYRPIFVGRAKSHDDGRREIEIEIFEDGRMIMKQMYNGVQTATQIWERVDRKKEPTK